MKHSFLAAPARGLATTVAFALGVAPSAGVAETAVRIADFLPPTHIFYTCSMEKWVEELEERAADLVDINYFGAGTILGPTEMLDGVRQGAADMGVMVVDYWPDRLTLASFSSLPFVFPDAPTGTKILHKLLEGEMGENFREQGIMPVMVLLTTPRQITLGEKSVDSLDDISGLKLRANGWEAQTVEALGASIVSISPAEVAMSQNSGIIDGSTQTYYGMPGWGLTDVTQEVVELRGYTHTLVVLGAATRAWESWPEEVRSAMSAASRDIEERWMGCQYDADDQVKQQLIDAGAKIYTVTDDELSVAREKTQVVIDSWLEATGESGEKVYEDYKAATAD